MILCSEGKEQAGINRSQSMWSGCWDFDLMKLRSLWQDMILFQTIILLDILPSTKYSTEYGVQRKEKEISDLDLIPEPVCMRLH